MGLLGSYIDGLSDDQRDRIIRATEWPEDGGAGAFVYPDGGRCLVGHAEDWFLGRYGQARRDRTQDTFFVSNKFPDAVHRFGLPRVVRAVKLRAAKANGTTADLAREHDHATVGATP